MRPQCSGFGSDQDDDDYMSMDVLKAAEKVNRPGVSRTAEARRHLRLARRKQESSTRWRQLPKAQMEQDCRRAALDTPISQQSKGFALMAKMGYKPGTALGKEPHSDTALKKPIDIDIKSDRSGLGHSAEEKKRRDERMRAYICAVSKRASQNDDLIASYKVRKKDESTLKLMFSDLKKSQKVCRELDMREDALATPVEVWYWPADHSISVGAVPKESCDDTGGYSAKKSVKNEHDELDYDYRSLDIPECLEKITVYLRAEHFYCVWCGAQFNDLDDLQNSCPGDCRLSHDCDNEDL